MRYRVESTNVFVFEKSLQASPPFLLAGTFSEMLARPESRRWFRVRSRGNTGMGLAPPRQGKRQHEISSTMVGNSSALVTIDIAPEVAPEAITAFIRLEEGDRSMLKLPVDLRVPFWRRFDDFEQHVETLASPWSKGSLHAGAARQ